MMSTRIHKRVEGKDPLDLYYGQRHALTNMEGGGGTTARCKSDIRFSGVILGGFSV
jgi:hypothetical protein